MSPRNLSSKVWGQWSRLVVNRDTPKKLKYTTSDLAPLNIKLVSGNDTNDFSWFEPWDNLGNLTLTEPESLNKLPTLDLEADEKLDVRTRQQRHHSYCYALWYAIQDRTESYSDLADFPRTHPGVSLSRIRPWSKIEYVTPLAIEMLSLINHLPSEENEFYKVDRIHAPGYPFTWGWSPLSLEEFCVRDRDSQETLHPHLQMAIFNLDCPDEDSILASELSALVQIIGIRSRQPTFSGTPNIAALLISFFGARQVRVIQAFYSEGNFKDEGKEEKDGEPKLTVMLEKAIELVAEDRNENEERMDEIIRWMACNPSF
ncbi:hypothetical protein PITC_079900 [Penicillium italicum]|uniref:Uncharacterized protein n=1 Tax=Penicillium italicum TaxID=40296 RepID=A0A0A2KFF3_PENIT|nr:hypothetical protein PITC_079900 [Penicillium italicum]